jgi:hypothetical protein
MITTRARYTQSDHIRIQYDHVLIQQCRCCLAGCRRPWVALSKPKRSLSCCGVVRRRRATLRPPLARGGSRWRRLWTQKPAACAVSACCDHIVVWPYDVVVVARSSLLSTRSLLVTADDDAEVTLDAVVAPEPDAVMNLFGEAHDDPVVVVARSDSSAHGAPATVCKFECAESLLCSKSWTNLGGPNSRATHRHSCRRFHCIVLVYSAIFGYGMWHGVV